MKVICDSEKQKMEFLYWINDICPSRLHLEEKTDCDYDCDECWKNSGLEVEVVIR